MGKLTIVTGLPGSGKTHLCKKACLNKKNQIRFSDVQHPNIIDTVNGIPGVIEALKSGYDCWVDDVSFCFEGKRQSFLNQVREGCQESILPVWNFFEYSPLKCLINIVGDATASIHVWESRFNAYVNHLKIKYDIPGDINPMRVEIHPDYLPILEHTDCSTLLSEMKKRLDFSLETNSQSHLISEEEATDLRGRANQLKDIWNQLRQKE